MKIKATIALAFALIFSIMKAESNISMDFQDMDVRYVLQFIASFSGFNVVITDQVKGNVTININDIPWAQALDIILQSSNLVKQKVGTVLLIMPAKDYAEHKKQELEIEKQISELVPLESELISLHYAKAKDIKILFQDEKASLLSSRGHVSYDERTNSLWLQDIPVRFFSLKQLIEQLDKPVKQVLIKAKIVTIKKSNEREIGVRFGVTGTRHLSGTLGGSNTAAQGAEANTVPLSQRLSFNLPATSLFTDPAKVGLAVAKLGDGILLDLELSAMEQESMLDIVASPHLIASHQQTAFIESGTEIPYQEKTSGGSTSATFKKAVMSMAVTPTITNDRKIVLSLRITQDKPGAQAGSGETIDTQHMETQVLVDDGETIVIGGINEKTTSSLVTKVPILGDIPIVGRLFQHHSTLADYKELLIFITSTVIKNGEV